MQQQSPPEQLDLAGMVADLNSLLPAQDHRDRHEDVRNGGGNDGDSEDPPSNGDSHHRPDRQHGLAAGLDRRHHPDDLVGAQCRAVIGLAPQDEKFLEGTNYVGVWHGTAEDARKRQEALDVVAYGQYQAMAVSPLSSGRLDPPDICLVYATPGQMIILINGLQYTGYKKFEWGVVGETACADFLGTGAENRRTQPVAAVLCRAPLWWRAG